MNLRQSPARTEDIAFRIIEDEVFAVSPKSGKYYSFNKVASYIWELADGNNTIDHIIGQVIDKYEVSPEVASEEVVNFIAKLESKGLIGLDERSGIS